MAKRAPRPGEGRPSKYTKELGELICDRIALGESVKSICKDPEMPNASTVFLWVLDDDKKEFSDKYAKARATQAELMFEEINEIADDGTNDYVTRLNADGEEYETVNTEHIQRSRLRVDTRKWYLSKVLPKKFGEKTDITSGGEPLKTIEGIIIQVKK